MKHKKSILEGNIIYTLFAILIGFLTGAIILAIAGMNPGVIYAKLFTGIFAKPEVLAVVSCLCNTFNFYMVLVWLSLSAQVYLTLVQRASL